MILYFIGFVDKTMEPILWFIASAVFYLLGIYFLNKLINSEKDARPFFAGVMVFMYGWGTARLIETIRRYYIGYYYDIVDSMNIFGYYNITGLNLVLRLIYITVSFASTACFFYVAESILLEKKTHFIFTITTIFQILISNLVYFNAPAFILILVIILFLIIGIFPICVVFAFGIKKFGDKTIPWFLFGIGLTLFVLGIAGDNPEAYEIVKGLNIWFIHYGMPLFVIGGSILISITFVLLYATD